MTYTVRASCLKCGEKYVRSSDEADTHVCRVDGKRVVRSRPTKAK